MSFCIGVKAHLFKTLKIAERQYHFHGLHNVKNFNTLEVIEYEVINKEVNSINLKLTSNGLKGNGVTKYKGTIYALLNRGY